MDKKFIAISGSIREESINTALLKNLQALMRPHNIEIEIVDIGFFPLFNQDIERDYPEKISILKNKIINSDGLIFSTPEYNRSIPGVLKNTIDWLSRPYGENAFDGKKALVLGASHSALGTALAQSHLKQILLYLNMRVMGQPEFYLSFAKEKFDEDGKIVDPETVDRIEKCVQALVNF